MGLGSKLAPLLAAAALGGILLTACGGKSGGSNTLTLYNGQHPQTTHALVSAFERQTGIDVKIRNGDEDVLANQLAEEGSSSPADLLYTENSPALEFLQSKALLDQVRASTLSAVASRYNSPQDDWVGVSARVSVMDYSTQRLTAAQLPRSIMDLAGPQWKDKLGLAPTETDFQPIVTSVAVAHGQAAALQWLKAVKANAGSHVYPDNESLTDAINKGTIALGVINHYYWYRQKAVAGSAGLHSAIGFFAAGDPGYVLDVSGAAALKSTKKQAAAQKFLAFLVSPTGQSIIAKSDSFEYPIGSGAVTAQPIPAFSSLHPNSLTVAQLGDGQVAIKLLQQAQLL
jgi:iron(III) transport system substrate-binding protein